MDSYQNYWQMQKQNELRKLQETQNRIAQLDAQAQMYLPRQNGNVYQPIYQNQNVIPGRIVNSFEEIQAQEVPMDNFGAEFVKADLSEIEIRRWDSNGKIVPIRFKRVLDEQTSILSNEEIESQNDAFKSLTDTFQSGFAELNSRFDKLESSIVPKSAPKKKEVVANE